MTSWSLGSFRWDGQDHGAVVRGGRAHTLAGLRGAPSPVASVLDVLRGWDEWEAFLSQLDEADMGQPIPADAAPRAPILYPPKLLCAGANYYRHLAEMQPGQPLLDKSQRQPFFFLKPPTTTVIGPGENVLIPPGSEKVDWEVELAVVIGRGGRNISVEQAPDHIAGYTVLVDISSRDLHRRSDWGDGNPFQWDWLASKGCDTFAPMGPLLVPSAQVRDPGKLRLTLTVNGQVEQDANTDDMVFTPAEQIAWISNLVTLEPGDVVTTGTPEGVGAGKGRFLKRGDVVVAEIEGLGRLENAVR